MKIHDKNTSCGMIAIDLAMREAQSAQRGSARQGSVSNVATLEPSNPICLCSPRIVSVVRACSKVSKVPSRRVHEIFCCSGLSTHSAIRFSIYLDCIYLYAIYMHALHMYYWFNCSFNSHWAPMNKQPRFESEEWLPLHFQPNKGLGHKMRAVEARQRSLP